MITKIYNCVFDFSLFFMFLSTYCKIFVSQFNILNKSNVEVIVCFFAGIIYSCLMLILLRCLSQEVQKKWQEFLRWLNLKE